MPLRQHVAEQEEMRHRQRRLQMVVVAVEREWSTPKSTQRTFFERSSSGSSGSGSDRSAAARIGRAAQATRSQHTAEITEEVALQKMHHRGSRA